MVIKSNAAPSEIASSYYKRNEEFCNEFENYIGRKNGKVKGSFNAWSYLIYGQINLPKKWNLMYEKATHTSTGNLWLSSKYQTLLHSAEWETRIKGDENPDFLIRKRTKIDFLRKQKSKTLSYQGLSDSYILEVKGNEPLLIPKLIELLKPLFVSGEIFKIEQKNEVLRIEMRTEENHFEIFERLINGI